MEQGRKIQLVAILALMIATMSLLVGFSSLNAQLEFAGTTNNIKNAKWNVHFGNVMNVSSSNEAYAAFNVKPNVNIDNPLAVNFGIAINQPSQTLSFDVDVLNEGAMDAQVSDVSLVGLESVSDAVTYEISGINVGDVIAAGDSLTVKVVVTSNYVYDATLNFAAINLDNVSLKVNFVQAK